eukprot:TRINITY_DN2285_c0_g4_i2.p1 TRINITY_DN2285_c0_g4~~TRINITY_DN2285_c0_g4_i2.p1  ORF type:complete len:279 (-),score=109.51 TRINITY_DN2285_c0_g4_i2:47-883(-)
MPKGQFETKGKFQNQYQPKFGGRAQQGQGMRSRGFLPKGKPQQIVIPHERFPGVFISKGKNADAILTKSLAGDTVYGEKKITIQNQETQEKTEYRVWNPYRSKMAAAIVGGISDTFIRPGCKVLYLGAASGTTVSHVSDIVGPEGVVYAVEFSQRSGRDLVNMSKKRTNIIPLIADARKTFEYNIFVPLVDVVFADVAQPDQARIVGINCQQFLKEGGHFMISIKANCIDSTQDATVVFENEVQKLKELGLKPEEQLTLEPYERDHAVIIGSYKAKEQ